MDRPVDPLTAPIAVARPVPAALAGHIAERAPRIVVVGDALLDGWLSGPARRLGRDGPVPVVELAESRSAPGGDERHRLGRVRCDDVGTQARPSRR